MNKENKKQVIFMLLVAVFLFIILIGIFLFYKNFKQNSTDFITTSFEGPKTITISSTLPISDELGKKLDGKGTKKGIQGYTEFTIKNNSNKNITYEICIDKEENKKEIRGNYIKFYLTDEINNPVKGFDTSEIPTYNDLLSLNDSPRMRLVNSAKINKKETKKFVLRAWLSDSYTVSSENKDFSFDIVVKTH